MTVIPLRSPPDALTLREAAFADIAVFDPATVDEAATFENPTAPSKGIEAVVVNGAVAWQRGRATGARSGRVLRREGNPRD